MKKLFAVAFALLFVYNASALDYEPKQGFSSMGFLGFTTSHIKDTPYKNKFGGTAGMKVEYTLPRAHGTYITAGIDWIMRGGKFRTPEIASQGASRTAKLHYIEIPVRAGFRYNLNKEWGFFGEAGPYFAVGVGGKNALDIDADGSAITALEKAGTFKAFKENNDDLHDQFQRWDAGIGFRIGTEYNQHYSLALGCDWGLADIYREHFRDLREDMGMPVIQAKNFNFSLSFGYRF